MALPAAPVVTGASIAAWLELNAPTGDPGGDPEQLEELAAAVDELVRGFPSVIRFVGSDPAPAEWPNRVTRGAKMLGGRLHRRRMSPEGVYTLGGGDAIAYVNRNDPDVARLLRLNMPAVG